jgi:hypothetical protein
VIVRGGNSGRSSRRWLPEEDQLLKELLANKTSNMLIATKLKRSWSAIQGRMHVLKLTKGTGPGRPARTSGSAGKAER